MSTTEAAAGNTTNGGQSLCWSYDSFGNGTAQSSQSGACPILPSLPPATAIYNANNQVTWTSVHGAALGLGYDAAGNVINDNLNSYLYDADGTRVAKGTITSMSCDPAVNGFQTTTDYVLGLAGEQVTEVGVNANGTLAHQHTNVWAGGKLLGTYDNDGLHFYLDDPLGTRRVQTDYAGAIEQQCVSFPFGDGESCTSTPTEHLFTGKERDAESGNDYFGARYYGSNMGRWMSPDWADKPEAVPYSSLDNPQSLNLYGYVLNNPLSKADPDGHAGCPPDCSTGNNVVDFFLGAANAFSSDNLAGAGRVNQTSPGGQLGAQLGDVGAMVQGAAQVVLGTGGNIAGVALDATGVGAAVGVPVNVVSTAVTVEGAGAATMGAVNLMKASGPKAANAPGITAGGQATDEHGNKLGPSGEKQINSTSSNTREGANNKALNEGSSSVNHNNPKDGQGPHFHAGDAQGNKKPSSTHHEYPQ
jgi:RHS repeat-associated protein